MVSVHCFGTPSHTHTPTSPSGEALLPASLKGGSCLANFQPPQGLFGLSKSTASCPSTLKERSLSKGLFVSFTSMEHKSFEHLLVMVQPSQETLNHSKQGAPASKTNSSYHALPPFTSQARDPSSKKDLTLGVTPCSPFSRNRSLIVRDQS